jgi:hypothetical protein
MAIISLHTVYLGTIAISIILAANMILAIFTVVGNVGIAQGQGNNATSPLLTPEQKAAMCNQNDTFVNDTESKICGIPPTPTNTTTSSANTTTGAEAPPSTLAPSASG